MMKLLFTIVVIYILNAAHLEAQDVRISPGIPQTVGSTVAALPACTAALEGTIRFVTDALTPAALATAVGGGAVHVAVMCLNTAWVVL
jgi:hypothetical protein